MPKAVYRCDCRAKQLPAVRFKPGFPYTGVGMSSLGHCNLQRHMGVNNLPKVVTEQHHGR